jgi:hypothetical protein
MRRFVLAGCGRFTLQRRGGLLPVLPHKTLCIAIRGAASDTTRTESPAEPDAKALERKVSASRESFTPPAVSPWVALLRLWTGVGGCVYSQLSNAELLVRSFQAAAANDAMVALYEGPVKSLVQSGSIKEATELLERMTQEKIRPKGPLIWNLVMAGWIKQGDAAGQREAVRLYETMKDLHYAPSDNTVALALVAALRGKPATDPVSVLSATARAPRLDGVKIGKLIYDYAGDAASRDEVRNRLRALQPPRVTRRLLVDLVEKVLLGLNEEERVRLDRTALRKPAPPADEERELEATYQEQLNLETRSNAEAAAKYQESLQSLINLGKGANTGPARDLLLLFFEAFVRAIGEEQRLVATEETGLDRSVYGPKLLSVKAENLAVITMHETIGFLLSNPSGAPVTALSVLVGQAVQAETFTLKRREEKTQLLNFLRSSNSLLSVASVNRALRYASQRGDDVDIWSPKVQAKVGAALIDILIRVARVPPHFTYESLLLRKKEGRVTPDEDWVPAFQHEYRWTNHKRIGIVTCLPELLEAIEEGHQLRETVHARYLPMLVAPKPWTSPLSGGYLAYDSWVMRFKGSESQRQVLFWPLHSPELCCVHCCICCTHSCTDCNEQRCTLCALQYTTARNNNNLHRQ